MRVTESDVLPDLKLTLWHSPWPQPELDALFTALLDQVEWRQEHLRMFGKRVALPRLTAWYGDPGTGYRYSGIVNEPQPWIPLLQEIHCVVGQLAGTQFNSVLLNRYRSGEDHVSWHADDEPAIDQEAGIVSVSFGATRRFQFRHRDDAGLRYELRLQAGEILHMKPPTQRCWRHRVPKERYAGERINLTFRRVRADQRR